MTNEVRSQIGRYAQIPMWLLAKNPSGAAIHVYATLLVEYADRNTGEAWPSNGTLAADTGLSKATIVRAKQELESLGALTSEPRNDANGGRLTNRLVIAL